MSYNGILAALVIALLLTFVFSGSYRHTGPLRGLLIFFLILFLASWASQLWINPIGPITWGISWVPLIFVPLIVSVLMIAAAGTHDKKSTAQAADAAVETSIAAVGIFFWFLLLILIIAVVTGYYYVIPPPPHIFKP